MCTHILLVALITDIEWTAIFSLWPHSFVSTAINDTVLSKLCLLDQSNILADLISIDGKHQKETADVQWDLVQKIVSSEISGQQDQILYYADNLISSVIIEMSYLCFHLRKKQATT